jgi:hypothetical protein
MADLYRQSSGAPSWSRNSGTYLPTAVNATKTGGNPAVGDNSMQLTMQSPQLHRLVNKRYYQIAPDVDAMTATVGVSACAPVRGIEHTDIVVDDDPTDRHSGPGKCTSK